MVILRVVSFLCLMGRASQKNDQRSLVGVDGLAALAVVIVIVVVAVVVVVVQRP